MPVSLEKRTVSLAKRYCRVTSHHNVRGTQLMGYIRTTHASIVAAYGEPTTPGELPGLMEWTLVTPAGFATLYMREHYDKGQVQRFHIGGTTPAVVRWIESDVVTHRPAEVK